MTKISRQQKTVTESSLESLGLSALQAKTYATLLERGQNKAHTISLLVGLKRPTVYKTLNELVNLSLVEIVQTPKSKVATYRVSSPMRLENLVENKKEAFEKARNSYDFSISQIISTFTLGNHRPIIQSLEGKDGLVWLSKDILREGKNILLFQSYLDDTTELLDEMREQQRKHGIKIRVISPRKPTKEMAESDKKFLVERRYLPENKFTLPAQILMYGRKVAITAYKESLITTIIANNDISQSFQTLFELIWSAAIDPNTLL